MTAIETFRPHPCAPAGKRCGVSLLELIIVLTIIGIMASLLFPAIHMVVQESRKTACDSQIYQFSLAMQHYMDVTRGYLPMAPQEDRPSGWAVALLPFMEETNLTHLFQPKESLNSAANLQAAASRPNVFLCPVTPELPSTIDGIGVTHYVLMIAPTPPNRPRRKIYWNFRDAPAESRFPWCSSPEKLWPDERFPAPHSSAFGF